MRRQATPMLKLALSACLLCSGPVPAATTGSTFGDILRGMATGLALLGRSNNTPGYNTTIVPVPVYPLPPGYAWPGTPAMPPWGTSPWSGGYTYPGYPYIGAYPRAYPRKSTLRLLQGGWEISNGGLFLVKDNMARLYLSPDRHQDLYIRADSHYVWMQPVGSQKARRYEHRIFDNRILLRDEHGNTLTLKRYRPEKKD